MSMSILVDTELEETTFIFINCIFRIEFNASLHYFRSNLLAVANPGFHAGRGENENAKMKSEKQKKKRRLSTQKFETWGKNQIAI